MNTAYQHGNTCHRTNVPAPREGTRLADATPGSLGSQRVGLQSDARLSGSARVRVGILALGGVLAVAAGEARAQFPPPWGGPQPVTETESLVAIHLGPSHITDFVVVVRAWTNHVSGEVGASGTLKN